MNDQDLHLIEKHWLGTLSPEEAAVFEKKKNDKAFQEQLVFFLSTVEAVEEQEDGRLKNMLEQEEQNWQKQEGQESFDKKQTISRRWFLITLSAAIVALVLWWLGREQKKRKPPVFQAWFEVHPNNLVQLERSPNEDDLLQESFMAYKNNDHEKAIALFDQLMSTSPDDNLRFYKANSLLALGRAEETVVVFKELTESDSTIYKAQSEWYLALAYLQLGDLARTKKALGNIRSKTTHPYFKGATELLQSLSQ